MKSTSTQNHKERCPVCGGPLKQTTVTHTEHDEHGKFFIYENVPALECQNCGEYVLSARTVRMMEEITETGSPTKKVETPVFDLANV